MGTQLLEEADKQMSFLNSLFEMMTSSLWSDDDEDTNEDFSNLQSYCFRSLTEHLYI